MIDSSALRVFRNTLALLPVHWALWALDSNERYVFLEGPCLEIIGVPAQETLGRSLEDINAGNAAVLACVREAMHGPSTAQVVFNGFSMLLAGVPSLEGGCVGVVLLLGQAHAETRPRDEPCAVMELPCDVPAVGAQQGDLLVVDPAAPGRVSLLREVDPALLPASIAAEVARLSAPASPAAQPCVWPAQSAGRRQERAAHLRLLP